jgi:hypothetical protein
MNEIINDYVLTYFNNETIELIGSSFTLLEEYDENYDDKDFINILTDDVTLDSNNKQDTFITLLYDRIDAIIKAHKLLLISAAELSFKIDVLKVFQIIQNTDQYEYLLCILNTNELAVDKLARIISYFTDREECDIACQIESFDDMVLDTLKTFLERQQLLNQDIVDTSGSIAALRILKKHYENQFLVGISLFESGINLNLTYESVLPFAHDYLKTVANKDGLQFAKDIISLAVLTKSNSPIKVTDFYKLIAVKYLNNLTAITKTESLLLTEINALSHYEDLLP